jgi:hypothetical protein
MSKTYTLNDQGAHYVTQFVMSKGKSGVKPEAWFGEAEAAASDAFERELTATIEVSALMSCDGVPHVLTLDEQWFDVAEIED